MRSFEESGGMQRGDGEEICPFACIQLPKFFFKSCTPLPVPAPVTLEV